MSLQLSGSSNLYPTTVGHSTQSSNQWSGPEFCTAVMDGDTCLGTNIPLGADSPNRDAGCTTTPFWANGTGAAMNSSDDPLRPPASTSSSDAPMGIAGGTLQRRSTTLAERASRASRDKSFHMPGLNLEEIQASSRDACDHDDCVANSASFSGGSFDERFAARFRGWYPTEEGRFISMTCPGAMRIVSYNVLASRYVTTDRYPLCPTQALMESHRAEQLSREILGCDPDIIALQEMSIEMFENHSKLGGILREKGYEGHHVVITGKRGEACHLGSSGSSDTMRREFEGVAIMYKKARFQSIEVCPVRFNLLAECDKTLLPAERARLQVPSHNVALVSVLQDRQHPNQVVIAGTMHAFWDAVQKPECQVFQMHHLLKQAEELKGMYEHMGDACCVMMGDFNAELNSYALNYALKNALGATPPFTGATTQAQGNISAAPSSASSALSSSLVVPVPTGLPLSSFGGPSTPIDVVGGYATSGDAGSVLLAALPPTFASSLTPAALSSSPSRCPTAAMWPPSIFVDWRCAPRDHGLVLHDTYASYCSRFPAKVTAVNPSTNGEGKVIDHILFEKASLVCVAVGKLGERAEIPNRTCPSDHYLLAAALVPVHQVTFSSEPLFFGDAEDGEEEDTVRM